MENLHLHCFLKLSFLSRDLSLRMFSETTVLRFRFYKVTKFKETQTQLMNIAFTQV